MYLHQLQSVASPTIFSLPSPPRKAASRTHLLPHLSSNVCQSLLAIKAHGLDLSIPQHLGHLCVFYPAQSSSVPHFPLSHARAGLTLSLITEDEFTLLCLVLVLTPPSVLASLESKETRQYPSVTPHDLSPIPVPLGPHDHIHRPSVVLLYARSYTLLTRGSFPTRATPALPSFLALSLVPRPPVPSYGLPLTFPLFCTPSTSVRQS